MIAPTLETLASDGRRARLDAPEFREDFRRNEPVSNTAMLADIVTSNAAVIGAFLVVISRMHFPSGFEWSMVPLAFLQGNLLEYLGHRFLLHGGRKRAYPAFRRHVLQHHMFHTDHHMSSTRLTDMRLVFFPALGMLAFITVLILPHVLVVWPLAGANAARLFVATMLVYFLNYEWMHFAFHTHEGSLILRVPGVRWLRALHRVHHQKSRMGRVNFNIAYPIFDFVFGTLENPTAEEE
jgi:sterol desaturase/sphingolipid hydroxylase (fatty acid hydroxylase superfamily)